MHADQRELYGALTRLKVQAPMLCGGSGYQPVQARLERTLTTLGMLLEHPENAMVQEMVESDLAALVEATHGSMRAQAELCLLLSRQIR